MLAGRSGPHQRRQRGHQPARGIEPLDLAARRVPAGAAGVGVAHPTQPRRDLAPTLSRETAHAVPFSLELHAFRDAPAMVDVHEGPPRLAATHSGRQRFVETREIARAPAQLAWLALQGPEARGQPRLFAAAGETTI